MLREAVNKQKIDTSSPHKTKPDLIRLSEFSLTLGITAKVKLTIYLI